MIKKLFSLVLLMWSQAGFSINQHAIFEGRDQSRVCLEDPSLGGDYYEDAIGSKFTLQSIADFSEYQIIGSGNKLFVDGNIGRITNSAEAILVRLNLTKVGVGRCW